MSFTRKIPAVEASWILAASDAGSCFLQVQESGPVEVFFSQTAPGTGVSRPRGVILSAGGLEAVSFLEMVAGDGVYVSGKTGTKTQDVVVMGSGVDPNGLDPLVMP